MILTNIARRKAIELDHSRLNDSFARVESAITLSLISKRLRPCHTRHGSHLSGRD
jgi:hypothetical protein